MSGDFVKADSRPYPQSVPQKSITYRARLIPESFGRTTLRHALCNHFNLNGSDVTIHTLAWDAPYGRSKRSKVATIAFRNRPSELDKGKAWELQIHASVDGVVIEHGIVLDTTFDDFTPITQAEDEAHTDVDCILIHGWGGHAVGSFSPANGSWFWPRDVLSKDFSRLRVWLYGYSSALTNTDSITSVYDYANTFRRSLRSARKTGESKSSVRPLLFIVHSLGGWVLQHAMIGMADSDNAGDEINLQAIRGALLFGVPNQGMHVDQMRSILQLEQQLPAHYTAILLDQKLGWALREQHERQFHRACTRTDVKLFVFYEEQKTPTYRLDQVTGALMHDGPAMLLVSPASATYGHYQYENKISLQKDHNNMLKFTNGDLQYKRLIEPFNEILDSIPVQPSLTQLEFSDRGTSLGASSVLLPNTDSIVDKAIHDADEAIRSYHASSNRLQIERLSGEKLSLERCYINLGLVNRSKQNHGEQDGQSFSLRARLRLGTDKINDSLSLGSLFESKIVFGRTVDKPRRIFIQGRAGIGKTTLCKKVVHEFQNNKLWNGLFDRLLWLPLRNLKTKENYGWQDLLQDVYSLRVENWDELANVMAKQLLKDRFLSKTLLLFDGLDEITHRWTRDDDMFKFVESIICDVPNVIITSRPQAKIFDVGSFDLELETIGFTSNQINEYLESCVRDRSAIRQMQALILKRPLVGELIRIPIQLDAFCCTWSSRTPSSLAETHGIRSDISEGFDENDVSTMTTLYQSITHELYRKDLDRRRKACQPRRLAEAKVRTFLQEELLILGEYAFQGMVSSIINFTPYHRNTIDSWIIKKQKSSLDSFVLEELSFLRTSAIEQDPSKSNYHFIHLTFQEFFAARHFVQNWCSNTELICLDLHSLGVKDKTISPAEFLQAQKYNPHLNIFWRFVTGLVQENSTLNCELLDEQKNILTLFKELNGKPVDLLGPVHRQLLMYCLSEVLPSKNQQIRDLRTSEESLLRQWIIKEFELDGRVVLGREAEYPEDILCACMRTLNDPSYQAALSALKSRSFISMHALRSVSDCINDQLMTKAQRIQAIKVIFEHSRSDSQDIVAQAAQFFSTMLKDEDEDIRLSAMKSIAYWSLWRAQPSLPDQVITALVTACKDDNPHIQCAAVRALAGEASSEATTARTTALKNKDSYIRGGAAIALRSCSSTEVVTALITALKEDENSDVRATAAEALRACSSTEATTALITALKEDENYNVRATAAKALEGHSSTEVSTALTTALEDKDLKVRQAVASALERRSYLPAETVAALTIMLKNEDYRMRGSAASALQADSNLPAEVIAILVTLVMEDQDRWVRSCAAEALEEQSSSEAINALIIALKHEDSDTRQASARALGSPRARASIETVTALTVALKDKDSGVRKYAAAALGEQPYLPPETIIALITVIEDQEFRVLDTLHGHSLFYSAIKNLSGKSWQYIWSWWIKRSLSYNISCYELEGCLYLWSKGTLHQISTDPLQTQALLQVVVPEKMPHQQAIVAPHSSCLSQPPGVIQTSNPNAMSASTSKSQRRWFRFKKGR